MFDLSFCLRPYSTHDSSIGSDDTLLKLVRAFAV